MKTRLSIGLLLVLALSCSQPKKQAPQAPAVRDFPMAEIPMMITQPEQRAEWIALHFWDSFTQPDKLYFCDSVTVNGVPADKLEQQVGLFASILQQIPIASG